jgi:hypothetical protein
MVSEEGSQPTVLRSELIAARSELDTDNSAADEVIPNQFTASVHSALRLTAITCTNVYR